MRAFVRLNSNGISNIILPLSRAVMDAQPIVIVLLFASLLMSQQAGPWDEIHVIALFVGLHWWAMLASRTLKRRKTAHQLLLVLGLVGAVSLVLITHRSLFAPIPWQQVNTPWLQGCGPQQCYIVPVDIAPFLMQESMLLTMFALILYSWLRGIKITNEKDYSAEKAVTSLKWNFIALMILLVLAALNSGSTQNALLASLTLALPLFFLSSLSTLSCTHLLAAYARGSGEQVSVIRLRTAALPLLWIAILIVVIILEVFVFPSLLALFQPLWSGIAEVIVAALNRLIGPQSEPIIRPLVHHHHENNPPDPHTHPLIWLITVANIMSVGLLVVLGVFLFRHFSGPGNDEGLVRERLSWKEWWRQRRRQRRTDTFKLEPLDPASARAQYRTFLLAMASREQKFARASEETPDEYQARLLAPLKQAPDDEATIPPTSLLPDLTNAYNRERYGGVQTAVFPYDRRQLSRLAKQLKRAARKE